MPKEITSANSARVGFTHNSFSHSDRRSSLHKQLGYSFPMALPFEVKYWLLLFTPLCMFLVACLCLVVAIKKFEWPRKKSERVALSEFDVETVDAEALAGLTCHICLEDFGESAKVVMLKCGHYYHKVCIGLWLSSADKSRRNCPTCRAPISRRRFANRDVALDIDGLGLTAISPPEAVAE